MENLGNRREILFVSSKEQAEKHLQKANFKGFQTIHDNLVSVTFSPNKISWSKPTPVGASIHDLSKLCLYRFHYDEMKPRYGNRLKVCYKDTIRYYIAWKQKTYTRKCKALNTSWIYLITPSLIFFMTNPTRKFPS